MNSSFLVIKWHQAIYTIIFAVSCRIWNHKYEHTQFRIRPVFFYDEFEHILHRWFLIHLGCNFFEEIDWIQNWCNRVIFLFDNLSRKNYPHLLVKLNHSNFTPNQSKLSFRFERTEKNLFGRCLCWCQTIKLLWKLHEWGKLSVFTARMNTITSTQLMQLDQCWTKTNSLSSYGCFYISISIISEVSDVWLTL